VTLPSATELEHEVAGQTVLSMVAEAVRTHGPSPALRTRRGDEMETLSWAEYGESVARVATGLRLAGVKPGDRVLLMMRNIPEFHVLDVAVCACGATPISIYNSSAEEQIAFFAANSDAALAVVESDELLGRFGVARRDAPSLRTIATVRGAAGELTYGDLLAHDPADLDAAAARLDPGTLATVIYTSGTTGRPKGVMLTPAQVCFTAASLQAALGKPREELAGTRVVSYLPMAHVAERMSSHYDGIFAGYEITTCPEPGLVGEYLRRVRPQIFFGVPRVWEKLRAGLLAALGADPDRLAQFEDGVAAAMPISQARSLSAATDEQEATWQFLDEVAFEPVRRTLGLDELFCAVSGAAPIPPDLLAWFRAIGVPLSEIYGLSESSGPLAWARRRVKPGTIGPPIPGCEVRLLDDGEILCRGGNVFAGYLGDPVRTAETLDADGWLHTGDIGELDDEGYLRVIDRKKELIITAGGKNISPANLEAKLKLVPLIGQACVVGDRRPFVAALLVLDPDQAVAYAEREGIEFASMAELAGDRRVHDVVAAGVDEAMRDFNHAEQIKKFVILGDEWVPDSDELTPTSKLKRRTIEQKYAPQIDGMYAR
jgi:long-chain acyl-CoA synthetase